MLTSVPSGTKMSKHRAAIQPTQEGNKFSKKKKKSEINGKKISTIYDGGRVIFDRSIPIKKRNHLFGWKMKHPLRHDLIIAAGWFADLLDVSISNGH